MRPKAKTNLEKMGFVDPDRKESRHDVLQLQILENPKEVVRSLSSIELNNLEIEFVKLEHPVISQTNYSSAKFIVGYIDVLISFLYNNGDAEYKKGGVFAIEIKTKIESFGDTLRQINTYKQYSNHKTVFVVASEDDRYKSQFESQDIRFYNFK